ncbi:MAG: SAM-dependent methyltransferase [Candidatus Endobugula sp.]|jgi:SAM-dependent methyltransferase
MSTNASHTQLYTDLSGYYDLLCADIDYHAQSNGIRRLHQIFGGYNNSDRNDRSSDRSDRKTHLDLGCGTGPHVRHFIDFGYHSNGLDIHQPMLDIATTRCPEAHFYLQDMSQFTVAEPLNLITCFLYSIHYNQGIKKLKECIASVHRALTTDGVFCFNAVDKNKIDNNLCVKHTVNKNDASFTFQSGWHFSGQGEQQSLQLSIEKTTIVSNKKTDANNTTQTKANNDTQIWHDEHTMVAFDFDQLVGLLTAHFDVHVFESDYKKIIPWDKKSGNAIFVCVKK